jgi:N-acetylglucosaminyl-diphospho-decaprenol L-rhamnosyltransferase
METNLGAPPRVSVSVVTYNSARQLPVFLESLAAQESVTWEAHFFDNASTDDTRERLQAAAVGTLRTSQENLGFGRGHNANLPHCRGEYVLLLNPDLQFGPGLFSALCAHLDLHPGLALAGPHIEEGSARRPFPPRHFYPGEGMVALEPGFRRPQIAWLSGCCLIVRREVLERLGGFDPDYFLYQEETDLCLRARRAGYQLGHLASSSVHHLHQQSQTGLSEYELARRVFLGCTVFFAKHYPAGDVLEMARFQYGLARLLLAFGSAGRWVPDLERVLREPRLRARRDVWSEWLARRNHRTFGVGGATARILLRQCRVLLEWLRQGRFPMDDY